MEMVFILPSFFDNMNIQFKVQRYFPLALCRYLLSSWIYKKRKIEKKPFYHKKTTLQESRGSETMNLVFISWLQQLAIFLHLFCWQEISGQPHSHFFFRIFLFWWLLGNSLSFLFWKFPAVSRCTFQKLLLLISTQRSLSIQGLVFGFNPGNFLTVIILWM